MAFRFLRRLRLARASLRVRGGCGGNSRGIPFALGGHGMVTAVRMALTASAFFFDVDNLSGTAYVTVTPHDAPTRQRRKAEEPNNAH